MLFATSVRDVRPCPFYLYTRVYTCTGEEASECKGGGGCHATDGPLKMGPPGPSVANYVAMDAWSPGPSTAAIDGPPGPSVAPQVVPPDHLWRRKWSPVATNGPP